jgi:hypothetical protein
MLKKQNYWDPLGEIVDADAYKSEIQIYKINQQKRHKKNKEIKKLQNTIRYIALSLLLLTIAFVLIPIDWIYVQMGFYSFVFCIFIEVIIRAGKPDLKETHFKEIIQQYKKINWMFSFQSNSKKGVLLQKKIPDILPDIGTRIRYALNYQLWGQYNNMPFYSAVLGIVFDDEIGIKNFSAADNRIFLFPIQNSVGTITIKTKEKTDRIWAEKPVDTEMELNQFNQIFSIQADQNEISHLEIFCLITPKVQILLVELQKTFPQEIFYTHFSDTFLMIKQVRRSGFQTLGGSMNANFIEDHNNAAEIKRFLTHFAPIAQAVR